MSGNDSGWVATVVDIGLAALVVFAVIGVGEYLFAPRRPSVNHPTMRTHPTFRTPPVKPYDWADEPTNQEGQ